MPVREVVEVPVGTGDQEPGRHGGWAAASGRGPAHVGERVGRVEDGAAAAGEQGVAGPRGADPTRVLGRRAHVAPPVLLAGAAVAGADTAAPPAGAAGSPSSSPSASPSSSPTPSSRLAKLH